MTNISLKQFVVCESDTTKAYRKINCTYWNIENSTCGAHCKLKSKEVSFLECRTCDVREPLHVEKEITNKRTHPFVQQMRDKIPQYNAIKKPTTEQIEEQKSFIEKAKSYGTAETSQMIQGKVSEEIFEKRKAICMSCEYRVAFAKEQKDSIGWCKGGCGCTVGNPRAALSQKLYMPTLSCPKKKFGPEKGEGFNISDAADSVKGIITSVKNLFEKDK
jgi:hypothetical protein